MTKAVAFKRFPQCAVAHSVLCLKIAHLWVQSRAGSLKGSMRSLVSGHGLRADTGENMYTSSKFRRAALPSMLHLTVGGPLGIGIGFISLS